MVCENFKDLHKRTAFDEVLHDKPFNIVRNLKKNMDINEILLQQIIIFLIKSLPVVLLHQTMN